MPGMSLRWTLHHHGWAVCAVADAKAEAEVLASYVTGGPEEFITAVANLVLGAIHTTAEFEAEPIIYRWVFDRDGAQLDIQLLEVSSPDKGGVVVWASRQTIDTLARAVVRAFDAVEAEHGNAGYQATWGRPFPSLELRGLRSAWRDRRRHS